MMAIQMDPVHRFGLDEDVKTVIVQWVYQRPRDLFQVMRQCGDCLNANGNSVNGLYFISHNNPRTSLIWIK
jgi:hypothetical protein